MCYNRVYDIHLLAINQTGSLKELIISNLGIFLFICFFLEANFVGASLSLCIFIIAKYMCYQYCIIYVIRSIIIYVSSLIFIWFFVYSNAVLKTIIKLYDICIIYPLVKRTIIMAMSFDCVFSNGVVVFLQNGNNIIN